ncbi:unnamed protein product [Spirodela intermedia]|uniref:Uncharacterized protein n=1 Tax=Spirodela intermedia TaxID=51605 RepID=A0A7I8JGU9_SPIIN|nr:unnamed protein product [Spirodela intermedia]CAA6669387.1 unnamed protein product [Spirodela intermedia]
MVFSYEKAISGFAARLTPEEVEAMRNVEGFLSALPDEELEPLTTYTSYFLGLNRVNGPWNATKMGAGMIVGVIDSGINPFHASFDDANMPPPPKRWRGKCDFNKSPVCNNKLIGARNFAASTHLPFDVTGHGTHVASTVAGNFVQDANVNGYAAGVASGVAPRAHLAIYKARSNSELLAAVDQAIYDRVDVLSISMGLPSERFYHRNSIAVGALAATEHGILVNCAAGNSGPFHATLHNDAPWVTTCGAQARQRGDPPRETLDGLHKFPDVSLPLVFPGDSDNNGERTCVDKTLGGVDVAGKIVLCVGDEMVPPSIPGQVVARAGAAAMILANSAARGYTILVDPSDLPTVRISHSDAQEIISYLRSFPNPEFGLFRGVPCTAYSLPPRGALLFERPKHGQRRRCKTRHPGAGVNILGATLSGSSFAVMSGTSMAAPHVSGVAALIKAAHPRWSPAAIKSAMMTTSYARDKSGSWLTDQTGNKASIYATGAGHVNPLRASDPGLVYDIDPRDYVGYLCGVGYGDDEVSIVARRTVNCAAVKTITAGQLNYPIIAMTIWSGWPQNVSRTVTNVGKSPAMYTVAVDMAACVEVTVTPSTLSFTRSNQRMTFTATFTPVGRFIPGMTFSGELRWVSASHVVRSPLSVFFS